MLAKVVLGVLLAIAVSFPALALHKTEMDALATLNASFPALLYVSAFDEYDEDYTYYGTSWNSKSLEEVCNEGAGWDIHGVYCGASGHIQKLRFTNSWGDEIIPLSPLQLPFLKEFVVHTPSSDGPAAPLFESACGRLLTSLSTETLAGLEVLEIPNWNDPAHFPLAIMSQLQALRKLTALFSGGASTFQIRHLSRLEYVSFLGSHSDSMNDFSLLVASNATLRELYMPYIEVINHDMLMNFSVLHTAHIRAYGWKWSTPVQLPPNLISLTSMYWPVGAFTLISNTLQSLTLYYPLFAGFTDNSLPSSLQSLSITGMANTMTWPQKLPLSLRTLSLDNPETQIVNFRPGLFDDCTAFHTLIISRVTEPAWDGTFPSLAATSLEKIVLEKVLDSPQVGMIICRSPSATLKHLILDQTNFGRFPDCISQYTGLETLSLVDSFSSTFDFHQIFENVTAPNLVELVFDSIPFNGQNPDWSALIAQFPNLQKIDFSATPTIITLPFPVDALMSLADLRYLSLRNTRLNGTLPTDWFTKHPKLEYLRLSSNILSGTIPTAGWSKLQYVDLSYNQFTDFPYIEWPGAPELEELNLGSNKLSSIPSDSVFTAMSKLKTLIVASNPTLGGPLPLFWTHGTSKLNNLFAYQSGFSGSIPYIRSPFIRAIAIYQNSLCGSLPEIPRSVALKTLNPHSNQFQGSIPASWSSHLTIMGSLTLRDIPLSGTLPTPLFAPLSRFYVVGLDFGNTYLSGPFANLTGYSKLNYIAITGTNMRIDACAADPTPESTPSSCTIPPDFGCECDTYYQWCNRGGASCPPAPLSLEPETNAPYTSYVPAPIHPCIDPPPRQEPPRQPTTDCPLPIPGPSFTCFNGVWTASGSISIPTLTVSPGSVVVVEGNLTISTGTIQIGSIGVTIQIEGCLFFEGDGEIIITLTEEDMELLEKEKGSEVVKILIQSDGECASGTDLSMVKVDTKVAKESCKKVKTKKDTQTNRGTLALAFQLDSSKCNLWWIILVSVLGGIVVIIVVVILLVSFNPTCRNKVRPFWKRS